MLYTLFSNESSRTNLHDKWPDYDIAINTQLYIGIVIILVKAK